MMSREISWLLVQELFVCLFVFNLWHLPRNKIVVCNKLQNQVISEVIREMWETEIAQGARDVVKDTPHPHPQLPSN